MRNLFAIFAGLTAGFVVIFGVEMISHMLYPPPAGLDTDDPEALRQMIEQAPIGALLFVILAWALGAFTGGWIATWISKKAPLQALTVGGLLLIAGIVNLMMLPHPIWFWVVGLAVFLPGAYMGSRLVINP